MMHDAMMQRRKTRSEELKKMENKQKATDITIIINELRDEEKGKKKRRDEMKQWRNGARKTRIKEGSKDDEGWRVKSKE